MFLLGFCVFNAVNDAIVFTGISFTPFFWGETSSWNSTLEKKNFCVREMAVEVGYSLVVLGTTWGTFRVYPYNRDVAIIFLSTECAASFCSRVYCVWLSGGYIRQRCVVNSNSLNPSHERLVRLNVKVITCCAPVCLKNEMNLSLSFGLTTIPTSFCGRSVLTLKFEFLSIIWLFPSFYLRLLRLDASTT